MLITNQIQTHSKSCHVKFDSSLSYLISSSSITVSTVVIRHLLWSTPISKVVRMHPHIRGRTIGCIIPSGRLVLRLRVLLLLRLLLLLLLGSSRHLPRHLPPMTSAIPTGIPTNTIRQTRLPRMHTHKTIHLDITRPRIIPHLPINPTPRLPPPTPHVHHNHGKRAQDAKQRKRKQRLVQTTHRHTLGGGPV
jgi:hypothetical protein